MAGMKLILSINATSTMRVLPARDREALMAKLEQFAASPYDRYPWAKAFSSNKGRIRHGDWRAIYEIDKGILTVMVIQVGHRREIYR